MSVAIASTVPTLASKWLENPTYLPTSRSRLFGSNIVFDQYKCKILELDISDGHSEPFSRRFSFQNSSQAFYNLNVAAAIQWSWNWLQEPFWKRSAFKSVKGSLSLSLSLTHSVKLVESDFNPSNSKQVLKLSTYLPWLGGGRRSFCWPTFQLVLGPLRHFNDCKEDPLEHRPCLWWLQVMICLEQNYLGIEGTTSFPPLMSFQGQKTIPLWFSPMWVNKKLC